MVTHLELDQKMAAKDDLVGTRPRAWFLSNAWGPGNRNGPIAAGSAAPIPSIRPSRLKEENPDRDIYILYRDLRTFGEREDLYKQARQAGILFIRYSLEEKPQVAAEEDGLTITVRDHILIRTSGSRPIWLPWPGPSSRTGTTNWPRFKVPLNEDGFFVEAHAKLRPVDFATDGVFLCGLAHYPKPMDESIAQAQAAVARAVTLLAGLNIKVSGDRGPDQPGALQSMRGLCRHLPLFGPGVE